MPAFVFDQSGKIVPTDEAFASEDKGLTEAAHEELNVIKEHAQASKQVLDADGNVLGTLYSFVSPEINNLDGPDIPEIAIVLFEGEGYNDPEFVREGLTAYDMNEIFAQAYTGKDAIVPEGVAPSEFALLANGAAEITNIGSRVVIGSDPERETNERPRFIAAEHGKYDSHIALGAGRDVVTVLGDVAKYEKALKNADVGDLNYFTSAPPSNIHIHGYTETGPEAAQDIIRLPEYTGEETDPARILGSYGIELHDVDASQLEVQSLPDGGVEIKGLRAC